MFVILIKLSGIQIQIILSFGMGNSINMYLRLTFFFLLEEEKKEGWVMDTSELFLRTHLWSKDRVRYVNFKD